MLFGWPVLRCIVVVGVRLELQALRRRRNHAVLLAGEEGNLLFLQLPLLVPQFLLLKKLDLSLNVVDNGLVR